MTRSRSDTLSLTLPSRTRNRSKWRKPRKPTFAEAWCLCWFAMSIVFAIEAWVGNEPAGGIYQTFAAAVWWNAYQRARQRTLPVLRLLPAAVVVAGGVFLLATGWR